MASRRLILPLLGSIIATASGIQDLEPLPETYCVTYLSTYLLPLSAVTTGPVARESSSSPSSNIEDLSETFYASLSASTQVNISQEIYDSAKPAQAFESESGSLSSVTPIEDETITTTILSFAPTAHFASTTGAPEVPPGGRAVLFRVTVDDQEDTRGIQKRDIGGFVGTQTDDCNAANTFRLVEGQLIDNDAPIFYAGEDFKPLRGQQGAVPEGAITKTFASQGGILTFTNSDLPNGGANFCQDPNDGQVYITFTSAPANCVPVRLAVVDVELCDQEGIVESTTLSQSLPVSTEPSIPSTASSEVPQNPKTTADASEPIPVAPTSRLQTTSDFIPPPIIPTSRLQTSSFRFFNTSTFSNPPAASTEQVEPTFIFLETSSTLVHILPDPSTSEVQSLSSEAIPQPEDTTTIPSLPTDMLSTETLSTKIPIESDDTSTNVIESTTVIAVSESKTETLSTETTTIASSEASLADTATVSETATSSDMEIDSTTTTGVVTSEETTSSNDATTTDDTAISEATTTAEDDTTTEDAATICVLFEFVGQLDDDNSVLSIPGLDPVLDIRRAPLKHEVQCAMEDIVRNVRDAFVDAQPFKSPTSGKELCTDPGLRPQHLGFGVFSHECGTMRMDGPKGDGVVDSNLKVKGLDNLWICDLSVMPVSPEANPSLTLAALSLRLAEHLSGDSQ
ncbi:hypothetical protein ACHAP7_009094 [Fusarium lateritium]